MQVLKAEFKDHFRNISRIMDCVGCDKCRLWGKLQVTGLGTALKILFAESTASDGEVVLALSRSEVVAFVNTLNRLSESLAAVGRFRALWAERHGLGRLPQDEAQAAPPRPSSRPRTSRASVEVWRETTMSLPAHCWDIAKRLWRVVSVACRERWHDCLDVLGSRPSPKREL